jgi:hypothetical protein
MSSSSNNSNFENFANTHRIMKNSRIQVSEENTQLVFAQDVGEWQIGGGKPWSIIKRKAGTRLTEANREQTKRLHKRRPLGSIENRKQIRHLTNQEASLIKKLTQFKGDFLTLQHSSPYLLGNVGLGVQIVSPRHTYFHTIPGWRYHKGGNNFQVYIPVHVVESTGKQSNAFFKHVNNNKGYSTIIMPEMKSTVVNIVNKKNGGKRIISVYNKK